MHSCLMLILTSFCIVRMPESTWSSADCSATLPMLGLEACCLWTSVALRSRRACSSLARDESTEAALTGVMRYWSKLATERRSTGVAAALVGVVGD